MDPQLDAIYKAFVDDNLIQAEVAKKIDISQQRIGVQKHKLLEAEYILPIGYGLFKRGPRAKFFEQARKIISEIKEGTKKGILMAFPVASRMVSLRMSPR